MSDVFFAELGIRHPDHVLDAGSGTHAVQTCRVMKAFEPLVAELTPDVVVVVGDVNSTLACALVTAKLGHRWRMLKRACAAATSQCPRRSTGSSPTGVMAGASLAAGSLAGNEARLTGGPG